MTPALKTSVTYELSGVVETDSQVDICPDPGDDAKAVGDTVEYAPTFVFMQENNDVTANQTPKAQPEGSAKDKQTSKVQSEDSATHEQNTKAQSDGTHTDNSNPEAPPGSTPTDNQNNMALFLNVGHDLLDKLTDVLNFGRILSIGVPGFIVNFSLLMLFSLFSARMPTPTHWVIEKVGENGVKRDTIEFAQVAGSAVSIAPLDSGGTTKTPVPLYYEQNPGVHGLSFIDRSRIEFDAERIVNRRDYWVFWLIGAILIGSLISQWGYRELRKREVPYGIWTRMIRLAGRFDPPRLDMVKGTRAWDLKKLRVALGMLLPDTPATEDDKAKDPYKTLKSMYDTLQVDLELARYGSDEPSWSTLHLPLLRQNMIASQSITYWDHLTKEYWRFAEFAVNCPAAVCLFCVFLGSYFLLLSAMYDGGAWLVGIVLVSTGIAVFVAALWWWNPTVALAAFNNYGSSCVCVGSLMG